MDDSRTPDGPRGAALIAAERERQRMVEGFDEAHDDRENDWALVDAARCYLHAVRASEAADKPPVGWPWDANWWKPTPDDPVRTLVKAGALIAAEIDRLLRARERSEP